MRQGAPRRRVLVVVHLHVRPPPLGAVVEEPPMIPDWHAAACIVGWPVAATLLLAAVTIWRESRSARKELP